MNITRENYEAYIIDYLDGRLDPVQSTELMQFLSRNPDLEKEFNEFENIKINSSDEIRLKKEDFRKDFSDIEKISSENFDEFCVANFEGDLNDNDEHRLKEYLNKHPEKQKDFDLYSKIYLSPDYNIKYPEKNSIKKISPFIQRKNLLLYLVPVAAAVLLFIFLIYMPEKESKVNTEVRVANNITEKNITPQKEYENNVEVTEKQIPEEKILKAVNNIGNNQGEKGIPANLDKHNISYNRDSLEYLTPISLQLTNAIEYPALNLDIRINSAGNLHYNKFAKRGLADQDAISKGNISIYGINLNKINVWTLAEAGIKGFNYLTESEVLLNEKINNKGEVVAFAINSESFSISTPLRK